MSVSVCVCVNTDFKIEMKANWACNGWGESRKIGGWNPNKTSHKVFELYRMKIDTRLKKAQAADL